jgi:hypothetical protein
MCDAGPAIFLIRPHYSRNACGQARIFHELLWREHEDGCATWQPQGVGPEACLNGTSQGSTPEDARKDGHIRGRSKWFMTYPGYRRGVAMKESIKGLSLYVPGALFVMFGILVVFFPILLVGLFSAGLIVLGITALSVAHHLRRYQRNSHWTVKWEQVDPFVEKWQHRVFVQGRW